MALDFAMSMVLGISEKGGNQQEEISHETLSLHAVALKSGKKQDFGGKALERTNVEVLLVALKKCSITRNLEKGKQVHVQAIQGGHDCNVYIANALISMYAKCGSILEARDVFDGMKQLTVVSWNSLILGYASNGQGRTALELFSKMRIKGPAPSSATLVATLKACTCLAGDSRWAEYRDSGKKIHSIALECGCDSDVYVQNTLIDMFAKCGSMDDARKVFDSMKLPDVVSWNAMIQGYADNGQGDIALDLFSRMRSEGPLPDSLTLVAALKACTSLTTNGATESRDRVQELHNFASENSCMSTHVQNTLIDMYAKCGSVVDAQKVFDGMTHPTVVSWNILILGYADNGHGQTALDLFTGMRSKGPEPDSLTLVAAFKALASSQCTECRSRCKALHNVAAENGCNSDTYVQNSLIDIYAKVDSLVDARQVFDSLKQPTVVSWTALISGYAENGQGVIALDVFNRMKIEGPVPDSVTVVSALKACVSLLVKGGANRRVECRDRGKDIHNFAIENGCNLDIHVQNSLIDMYSKCGSMVDAREVFNGINQPDVVSWNLLVSGYADNAEGETSLDLFTVMRSHDSATFVSALKACINLSGSQLDRGKGIHNMAVEKGFNADIYVQNTVIDMYRKCGSMHFAHDVFDCMKHPDVVSWTTLILGYAEIGQGHTALGLFTRMESEGIAPNSVTFGAALKASGLVGALDFGRTIHLKLVHGDVDVVLMSCLVDFYSKCGSLVEARKVFDSHAEKRDLVTWTTLMAGFSSCGDSEAVFELFQGMQDAGFRPNDVTFVCILTCCTHAGLVEKGKEFFEAMAPKYGVVPTIKHYTCMIDLLGRANKLDEAMTLLESMPCSPSSVTWMTILNACRKWKNVDIGRLAFQSLMDLNHKDASACVLMGQIYWSRGMLQEQGMVLGYRKQSETCLQRGETYWTNESGDVHTFTFKDRHYPEIHDKWNSMEVVMRQHGYKQTEDEKEVLCGHTERMALVYALINTEPGKIVRIVKSLSVCDNCHFAISLISKLEWRTIICRDTSRIHTFKDGKCSCNDLW